MSNKRNKDKISRARQRRYVFKDWKRTFLGTENKTVRQKAEEYFREEHVRGKFMAESKDGKEYVFSVKPDASHDNGQYPIFWSMTNNGTEITESDYWDTERTYNIFRTLKSR